MVEDPTKVNITEDSIEKAEMGSDEQEKNAAALSDVKNFRKQALREILQKMAKSHPDESYHFRVKRRQMDGSWSYFGRCPGSVDDIEDYVATKYRDGHYKIFCHWSNGRLVPDVPVIEMMVGNPNAAPIGTRPSLTAPGMPPIPDDQAFSIPKGKSERVREIEEEIEAKRKQKELLRVEKELEREHQRLSTTDEDGDPVARKLEAFEENMERLQEQLEEKSEAMSHIRKLELEISRMRSEEREARLKAEYDRKIDELKAEMRRAAAPAKTGLGAAEYIQLASAVAPIIQAYMENSRRSSERMVEAVERVGTLVTQSMPKGLDLEKVITLAPAIVKLIPRGPDMSGMFNMMGEIIPTVVEAAAASAGGGGGGGDEIGGMIKQVLATVQKAMDAGRQPQQQPIFLPAPNPPAAIAGPPPQQRSQVGRPPAPSAVRAQAPAAVQAEPPVQAAPPVQKKTRIRSELPVVAMAKALEQAIRRRDERFDIYAVGAQTTLSPAELDRIATFRDGDQLGNYLRSQPGVDGGVYQTTYGKSWLKGFLRALAPSNEEPEAAEEEDHSEEAEVETVTPEVILPAPKKESAKSATADQQKKKEERFEELQRNPRSFKYPEDSDLDMMMGYGTPAGDLDLVVEIPTPEVLAAREAERREMVKANTNPAICNIKFPSDIVEEANSVRV